MRAILLLTGGGPLVILTSFASTTDLGLLMRLEAKGIDKFVAFDVPLDLARQRYGAHFSVVEHDLRETDDLRVLDYNGGRAFQLFRFDELGTPQLHEGGATTTPYVAGTEPVRAADDLQ